MDTNTYFKDLDAVAKEEATRLWNMRDELEGVSEATLPIVKQYAITYSFIQTITNEMTTKGDISNVDKLIARMDKMQKMLIQYAKLLKLDSAKSKESDNKFIKFLKKKSKK